MTFAARLLATTACLDALEAGYRRYVETHWLWPYPDKAEAPRMQ